MRISDLLIPVGAPVSLTQPLTAAARLLDGIGLTYVTLTHPDRGPISFLTQSDLHKFRLRRPTDWQTQPCAAAAPTPSYCLGSDATLNDAVETIRAQGVRPLLVRDGGTAVGVLEPTAVFHWCAENLPSALDDLAYLASAEERSHYPAA